MCPFYTLGFISLFSACFRSQLLSFPHLFFSTSSLYAPRHLHNGSLGNHRTTLPPPVSGTVVKNDGGLLTSFEKVDMGTLETTSRTTTFSEHVSNPLIPQHFPEKFGVMMREKVLLC